MKTVAELRKMRARALDQMQAILSVADKREDAALSEEENRSYDEFRAEVDRLDKEIERRSELTGLLASDEPMAVAEQRQMGENRQAVQVAAFHPRRTSDSEESIFARYVRSGDQGAMAELRASNATDMNVTTAADGGYAVPTGHYREVIARRDEEMLATVLGVRLIPGKGTTVNVPLDGEADGEFVATSEGTDHDLDAPAMGQAAMTLVRYTKKIQLSWELLEDEDSRLLDFIANFVGRGMAKTHNSLLTTEVATNGTALKTTSSATVLAAGELEDVVFATDLAYYLSDMRSVGWVMKPPTYAKILSLGSSSVRLYGSHAQGENGIRPDLLGYPVYWSNNVAAYGTTGNKFAQFGNWNYVGYRDPGQMTVLRDPYSYEAGIELRYQFRTVYKVLQAEAVGYVKHA